MFYFAKHKLIFVITKNISIEIAISIDQLHYIAILLQNKNIILQF